MRAEANKIYDEMVEHMDDCPGEGMIVADNKSCPVGDDGEDLSCEECRRITMVKIIDKHLDPLKCCCIRVKEGSV